MCVPRIRDSGIVIEVAGKRMNEWLRDHGAMRPWVPLPEKRQKRDAIQHRADRLVGT